MRIEWNNVCENASTMLSYKVGSFSYCVGRYLSISIVNVIVPNCVDDH